MLFAVLMAVATFAIRLWLRWAGRFSPLNLQFPFFVQYIALFVVGLIAYRRNWLANLSDSTGKRWLTVAIVLILMFVPMALVGGAMETAMSRSGAACTGRPWPMRCGSPSCASACASA